MYASRTNAFSRKEEKNEFRWRRHLDIGTSASDGTIDGAIGRMKRSGACEMRSTQHPFGIRFCRMRRRDDAFAEHDESRAGGALSA
jgi:hypothetical protein